MTYDTSLIVLIAAVLLLAGFVKGIIGFGLPSISMGLLGLIMAPSQAAALLLAPNIVTNIIQGMRGPALVPLLKRLFLFLAMTLAGALAWEWLTGGKDLRWATQLLGLTLVIYALLGLFRIQFRVPAASEGWIGAVCGLATGAMTIATGVFVIPSGPYLQSLGLQKDDLVQALGLSFLVASLSLGLVLGLRGSLGSGVAASSIAALVPAMGAMFAGQLLRNRISAEIFRRLFFAGLLALGGLLLMKG